MSADKAAKLVKRANQIGDYFASQPVEAAVAGAATHIRQFWTVKMIREIVAEASKDATGLNPTAYAAVKALGQSPQ